MLPQNSTTATALEEPLLPETGQILGHGRPAQSVLHKMLRGILTVASLTLLAKTVSFFKEATVASHFGIADELDAFVLSFTLLSFLSAMLGEGMPDAFLPVFMRALHRKGPQAAYRVGLQMVVCNLLVFGALGITLYFTSEPLITWMSRGFGPEKKAAAAGILRSLIPFFIASGMTFHLAAWLRAQKYFAIASIAPALAPVVIIISLLGCSHNTPVDVLVRATNIGVILHMAFLIVAAWRVRPPGSGELAVLSHWEPESTEVLRNTAPFLMAGVVLGSASFIDQMMASWLAPGSVATLGYSEKITSILLALLCVPAAEAVFPYFADAVARLEWRQLKRQLLQVTGMIMAAVVPLTLLMCLCAPFVVRVLFERGAFTAADTERVAWVLRLGALQVPFYMTSILTSRLLACMLETKFIMGVAVMSLAVNVIFNWLFMRHMGVAGIALSTVFVHLFAAVAFSSRALSRIGHHLGKEARP